MLSHLVPMSKHLMQAELHGPSKQTVHPYASRQSIFDAVRQARSIALRFEFVAVNPFGKGSLSLFVRKEAVLLISNVESGPLERPDPQFHSRTGLDTAGLSNDAHRGKGRT